MTLLFVFLLLVTNISLLFVFKSEHKFWFISILLWLILLATFITWRLQHDQYTKHLEDLHWQSATGKGYGDYDKREKLEAEQNTGQRINMNFIDLLGLQTLLAFGFQLAGKKTTGKKIYKWTFMIFSIIFALYLFLRLMIGIVPTTGYVT